MSFLKPFVETFTRQDHNEYAICGECLCAVINGDAPADNPQWSWDNVPEGNWVNVSTDDAGNELSCEGEFSPSGCEFCDNGLGNNVYPVINLNEQFETIEGFRFRYSAPGFTDSTDWEFHDNLDDVIESIDFGDLDEHDFEFLFNQIIELTIAKILPGECIDIWETFWQEYVLCLMFTGHRYQTEQCNGDSAYPGSGEFGDNYSYDELWDVLTSDQKLEILSDCFQFCYQIIRTEDPVTIGYLVESPGDCGSDFCLTRNNHGAGFWDRGLGNVGDKLTKISNGFGEQSLTIYGQTLEEYLGDDISNWVGHDADIGTSLFEYGLIWKNEGNRYKFLFATESESKNLDSHFAVVHSAFFDNDTNPKTEWNWVDWAEVAQCRGCTVAELQSNPLPWLVYNLVSYYGWENVFGSVYHEGITVAETMAGLDYQID
jgi:hypothetical protein